MLKNLSIRPSSNKSFSLHLEKSTQKSFAVLWMIRRNFSRITCMDFQILHWAYITPPLEHANQVVYSGRTKDLTLIERVQRAATKMVVGLKSVDYEMRLAVLDFFPLEYRRLRGDLILTYALFEQGLANRWFEMASTLIDQIQWTNFAAGVAAGAASTVVVHPLDLAKVRLQADGSTSTLPNRTVDRGTFRTLTDVVKIRGLRGLYLGLTPNVIGASGSWGLYFLLYAALRSSLQRGDATKPLTALEYFGCGTLAGSLTLTIMNPMWVIKTRLCLQYEQPASRHLVQPSISLRTLSTWEALTNLWRYEGITGLYKGYLPGLVGVSHGAVQFMLYEKMRNAYNERFRHRPVNAKLTSWEYFTFACLSKLAATSLTYPYQVVRTRLQDQHRQHRGAIQIIRTMYRCEGLLSFYKGLTPNLLRVTPACAVTFVVYEQTITVLNKSFST
ncbi:mitochondrial folate transporter/carrier [Clonorchis sinensis]|uniref:Mitochondrial folate transporter/carrier n=1 Tax=Clonorchis sinensis TaxID=79923 RepID=G7Y3M9_CLOSI|nr:mitochondrial folate transporter/carrier [Clonorchis sinensis]